MYLGRVNGRDFNLRIFDSNKKDIPRSFEEYTLKEGLDSRGYYVNNSKKVFLSNLDFIYL